MRCLKHAPILLFILFLLASCSSMQEKWNALTPDEKARTVLADFQDQLTNSWKMGKDYVALHPEHQAIWKEKVVPAFDIANKKLADLMKRGMSQTLTPDTIYDEAQDLITNVINYLIQIGAITGGK